MDTLTSVPTPLHVKCMHELIETFDTTLHRTDYQTITDETSFIQKAPVASPFVQFYFNEHRTTGFRYLWSMETNYNNIDTTHIDALVDPDSVKVDMMRKFYEELANAILSGNYLNSIDDITRENKHNIILMLNGAGSVETVADVERNTTNLLSLVYKKIASAFCTNIA